MLLTDNGRVKHTRLRVQRVDSWVDTKLSDGTVKHSRGVKVSKGRGRSRVSHIVGRDVNSLHRGDRALLGGGNTLLHGTHVRRKRGLVTDSRRNTTKQSRGLRTSLGETENVVNEEKHVLTLLVTEVLSDRETSKGHTGTGTRRLVHLTEHERHLRVTIDVNHTGLNHFMVQVIALTGTLTYTGED